MSKTIFNHISDDWKRVKNHCRTTINKNFTDNDATDIFKKKLLISEHTPIRLLEFDWSWKNIYYWVAMEWARHKFEKFISTQRDDKLIDHIPRGKKPQDTPVNYDGFANMQNLIDSWRKRLCYQATSNARELAEDFKITLRQTHKYESDVLVPNCVYRCGCPEFDTCRFWKTMEQYCDKNDVDITDIQQRYNAYNKLFYTMKMKRGNKNDIRTSITKE